MKAEMCIAAYVYGSYVDFIPSYVFSALDAYPEYYVKIFMPRQNTKHNQILLDRIKDYGYTRFEIIENYKICGHADSKKHARWLLPEKEFADFKYAYIGDIDFIILPEEISMANFHSAQMKRSKLPYSNVVRPNSKKLTGLHCYEVKPYYKAMSPVIEDCLENPIITVHKPSYNGWNEKFLYTMIKKAFGKPPTHKWLLRPHHGLHLGSLRLGSPHKEAAMAVWHKKYPHKYEIFKKELYKVIENNSTRKVSAVLTKTRMVMENARNAPLCEDVEESRICKDQKRLKKQKHRTRNKKSRKPRGSVRSVNSPAKGDGHLLQDGERVLATGKDILKPNKRRKQKGKK